MSTSMIPTSCSRPANGVEYRSRVEQVGAYQRDLQLARRAQVDPVVFERLCAEWTPTLIHMCQQYFLPGGELKDLLQEALIGLYKAIHDYNGVSSSLASFIHLCVMRQIITAVKTATRGKHGPLNSAVSFSAEVEDGITLVDVIPDRETSIHATVETRERLELLFSIIETDLSRFERSVVLGRIAGDSYSEIAASLGVDLKAVDNALGRVTRKLKKAEEQQRAVWRKPQPSPPAKAPRTIVRSLQTTARPTKKGRAEMSRGVAELLECIVRAGGRFEDYQSGLAARQLVSALGKSYAATHQRLQRAIKLGYAAKETNGKRTYLIRITPHGELAMRRRQRYQNIS